MNKLFSYLLALTLTLVPCRLMAAVSEVTSGSVAVSAPVSVPAFFTPDRFSFLAGPSILKGEVAPALALRYQLQTKTDLALELGGTLPHPVSGYASDQVSGFSDPYQNTETARIESYGEMHLALLDTFYRTSRYNFDGGGGLSLAVVNDQIIQQALAIDGTGTSFTNVYNSTKVIPAPWVQLGVGADVTPWMVFRLDVAYVYYTHHDDFGVTSFNLTFNGLMIRPALQVKF